MLTKSKSGNANILFSIDAIKIFLTSVYLSKFLLNVINSDRNALVKKNSSLL